MMQFLYKNSMFLYFYFYILRKNPFDKVESTSTTNKSLILCVTISYHDGIRHEFIQLHPLGHGPHTYLLYVFLRQVSPGLLHTPSVERNGTPVIFPHGMLHMGDCSGDGSTGCLRL